MTNEIDTVSNPAKKVAQAAPFIPHCIIKGIFNPTFKKIEMKEDKISQKNKKFCLLFISATEILIEYNNRKL